MLSFGRRTTSARLLPRASINVAPPLLNVCRNRAFHATAVAWAKSGKGKRDEEEESGPPVVLPNTKDLDLLMDKRVARLLVEFAEIRGGRVTPDMFNNVSIEAHGARMTLGEVGQATLKTSSKINVAVFDPDLVAAVVKGIRDSGHGLSPTSEGNNVIINVPKPSRQARENMVKLVGKAAERIKQDVRGIRKDGLDALKRLKGKISEDDTKRVSKEIEALTEKKLDRVSSEVKKKEKELSSEAS